MFRKMRRSAQQLPDAEAADVLASGKTGVLAVNGDGGFPYAVPMNYACAERKLYLHSATTGHKIDSILADDRVSFCVVDTDDVVPDEYTTCYRSVIAFGRARLVCDEREKISAIRLLADKYNPCHGTDLDGKLAHDLDRLAIIEVSIDHLTGKQGRKFAKPARTSG